MPEQSYCQYKIFYKLFPLSDDFNQRNRSFYNLAQDRQGASDRVRRAFLCKYLCLFHGITGKDPRGREG